MDELLGRQMPHSPQAEQAVIGSMLIDSRCVPEVVGKLRGDDFFIKLNRDLYETIYSMFSFSKIIDPVTVLDEMRSAGLYDEARTPQYVMDLMNVTPTAANVMEYAAIVRDMALQRRVAEAGGEIRDIAMTGEGGADTILEAAERKVYALRQDRTTGGLEPASKVLVNVFQQLSDAANSESAIPGKSTGLPDLDKAIMGLNDSDLILVAARPGMGKTSLAMTIALHVGKFSGKAVAIFSLEMSREQLVLRLLSGESYIDNRKLQTGKLSAAEWSKLSAAAAAISGANILIDDNPMLSVADMSAQCRRVPNLGLVVIDYLQLMQSAGSSGATGFTGENRQQIVSDISRMLKIMAKELMVPVICVSQLSRASEGRTNKRPMLSDLRESGAIEQDADIVLGIYRDDYYNRDEAPTNIAECIMLKNRRGETGTVELQWLPEYTTFACVDTRHEE